MTTNKKAGFEHTWRWFGPNDRITLTDIKQTGATGIVTALHQITVGNEWTIEQISERKNYIESFGLTWSVVESVPVSEDIKKQTGDYLTHIENYKKTLENLAACGIKTVCYNFMPVLDWSRTKLDYKYADGSESLRYEIHKFAAFDLFILEREAAKTEYHPKVIEQASSFYNSISQAEKDELKNTILLGLPGSLQAYTLDEFKQALASYANIDENKLREHLFFFLKQIVPVAEKAGVKLAIHPDDPPWALLGLPRVVGNYNDLKAIIGAVDSPANGITLCTGSLGAGYFNDLVKMAEEFGARVNFAHLRNVTRNENLDFMENNLFDGDVDILNVVRNLLKESKRRKDQGRDDWKIPMRPDHGFQMLEDLGQANYPGYGLYGRMKGLAEIRGLEIGLLSVL